MAHPIGPRIRQVRKFGTPLPGLTRKSAERKPYPPGQHPSKSRRRVSDYALQLQEKQKLRNHYGISESQFRNYVRKAIQMKGSALDNLPILLEHRLDNAVFRLGWAPTIVAARQLVNHGHICVNKHRVNIPSIHVNEGDHLSLSSGSGNHPLILEAMQSGPQLKIPSFLKLSQNHTEGDCIAQAIRADVPVIYEDRLVIEFYSAR